MLYLKRIILSPPSYRGKTYSTGAEWTSKVGLEIHAQLSSDTKLFSRAPTHGEEGPNTSVDLFDIALPGVLPQLNRKCIEYGLLTALATNSRINPVSYFDRKHYFYPDLAAGYQITQQRVPLAQDGKIDIEMSNYANPVRRAFPVRIDRIQLEHDSAKILIGKSNETLLDYNRSGVGLMEIVTAPDITNGEEAAAFIKELLLLLKEIRVCDGWVEPGSFRIDANISVHKNNQPAAKVEVKNIPSMRFVKKAISYEISRQRQLYEKGAEVEKETRMYDSTLSVTHATREKRGMSDYRFTPEPDLPPIWVVDSRDQEFHKVSPNQLGDCIDLAEVRRKLRELPNEKRRRLSATYEVRKEQIESLMVNPDMLEYLEKTAVLEPRIQPTHILTWMEKLVGLLAKQCVAIKESIVTPETLHSLMRVLYTERKITHDTATAVLKAKTEGDGRSPEKIVAEEGLYKIDSKEEIVRLIEEILNADPTLENSLILNKNKLIYIVKGRVIVKTDKRVDPVIAHEVISEYFM